MHLFPIAEPPRQVQRLRVSLGGKSARQGQSFLHPAALRQAVHTRQAHLPAYMHLNRRSSWQWLKLNA
jgi:hypothetical protein